jgi:hypothetical protein
MDALRGSQTPPDPAGARMFQRVLSSWALDALRLRRSGLDRPVAREGRWTDGRALRVGLAERGLRRLAG